MFKLLLKKGRKKYNEGRQHQMGFMFCKKIAENVFETVAPMSCCKDYLNDYVYAEASGKGMKVFGANAQPTGLFKDEVYLAFKILPKFGHTINSDEHKRIYPTYLEDIKNLAKTYINIEKLLNCVEELLKLEDRTVIYKAARNNYVAYVPKFWVQYTYLISLYSLLIRMGQFYTGENTPEQFLETYSNPLDKNLWIGAKPRFKEILTELPIQTFDKYDPIDAPNQIHSYSGIYMWSGFKHKTSGGYH